MEKGDFLQTVVKSLESILELYRKPYENELYERTICYEFYHQFRLLMGNESRFVLHGELDKRYRDLQRTPDFVFHVPGTDKNNVAVLEFKNADSSFQGVIDDLAKLTRFKAEPFAYNIGIFVIFGMKPSLMAKHERVMEVLTGHKKNIVVICYDVGKGKVTKISETD